MARHIDKHPQAKDRRAAQDTIVNKKECWAVDSGATAHIASGAKALEDCEEISRIQRSCGNSPNLENQMGRRSERK